MAKQFKAAFHSRIGIVNYIAILLYDRFSNRTFGAGTTIQEAIIAFAPNTLTNRITTNGYGYENAASSLEMNCVSR